MWFALDYAFANIISFLLILIGFVMLVKYARDLDRQIKSLVIAIETVAEELDVLEKDCKGEEE